MNNIRSLLAQQDSATHINLLPQADFKNPILESLPGNKTYLIDGVVIDDFYAVIKDGILHLFKGDDTMLVKFDRNVTIKVQNNNLLWTGVSPAGKTLYAFLNEKDIYITSEYTPKSQLTATAIAPKQRKPQF